MINRSKIVGEDQKMILVEVKVPISKLYSVYA